MNIKNAFKSKSNNRGGARPGAGRKPGKGISFTIQKEVHKFMLNLLNDEKVRDVIFKEYGQKLSKENIEKDEYFYIINGGNGLYKIGYTSSIKKRFKAYQTNSSVAELVFLFKSSHAFKYESIVLGKYQKDNTEWIELSEHQLEEIKEMIYKHEILFA